MLRKQTRWRISGGALLCLGLWAALSADQPTQQETDAATTVSALTQVLGRPTGHSIALNVLAPGDLQAYVEYGLKPGTYTTKTGIAKSKSRTPFEIAIEKLKPNARYYYRLRYREPGQANYATAAEYTFETQRPPGSDFIFDVQADSHPERVNRMFNAELYARTMSNVRKDRPDFYITLGDDFSIDQMRSALSPVSVAQVYINQRAYLGMEGSSAPIFLVNGNHEQAAKYLLNGSPNSPAVWAGNARNRYYPLPAPDSFYTGDEEPVEFIGLLRDYYAWTWGDALFITLDPYWHSSVVVDNPIGQGPGNGGRKNRDMWDVTHGEAQYRWLKRTLEQSKAHYKFVFAHHVLGTGRGGADMADQYEWGGKNRQGVWEFDKKRPGWELPIHQLMARYGVSIFFQGHDHIFVRQERDGVVYQETPNPANPNFEGDGDQDFRASYKTGDYLPSSGHLRVSVSPENAKVDYIRSWLPKYESGTRNQGEVAFSYTVKPGKRLTD